MLVAWYFSVFLFRESLVRLQVNNHNHFLIMKVAMLYTLSSAMRAAGRSVARNARMSSVMRTAVEWCLACYLLVAPVFAQPPSSTFTSGNEGWTYQTRSLSTMTVVSNRNVTWRTTGGIDDGFIELFDPDTSYSFFRAPTATVAICVTPTAGASRSGKGRATTRFSKAGGLSSKVVPHA